MEKYSRGVRQFPLHFRLPGPANTPATASSGPDYKTLYKPKRMEFPASVGWVKPITTLP